MRLTLRLRIVFLGMVLPLLSGCASVMIADLLRDDRVVQYRVDLMQPETQTLSVSMIVPTSGAKQLDFLLPVWRPGRYTVLNPAGTLRHVTAISEKGQDLHVSRPANSAWRVQTNGASEVEIRYTIYANSLGDRTRHLDPTHAFLSGSSVFLYVASMRHLPVRVEVIAPAGWDIATGLEPAPGHENVVVAPDYDVLVDSPLEIGEHDRIDFEVRGKPHEIVIWPRGLKFDAKQMIADFSTIVEEQCSIFGRLPYDRYVFLIHAKNARGGTEHLNSTIMQTSKASIEGSREEDGPYKRFRGLLSHEFFHTWNVKQFRPEGIHPYDYQNENLTDLLWVCEGTTSYYSSLTQVRAGLSEPEPYVKRIGRGADSLFKNPGARVQSVADASWDSWVSSYDADTSNRSVDFYGKGSQVSMCLDLELRKRTENRVGLDDVMRALFEQFPLEGRGYSSDDLLRLLEDLSGTSFEGFFAAYVYGTEPLPFAEVLPTVGLELCFKANQHEASGAEVTETAEAEEAEEDGKEAHTADTAQAGSADDELIPTEIPMKAYLGLRLGGGGSGCTVQGFRSDGPAYTSGLMLGDELLTLNEKRLRPDGLEQALADLKVGDVVKLHYLRDDRLRVLEIELGGEPDGSWEVHRLEHPSQEQKAAYADWIGHPWPDPESDSEKTGAEEKDDHTI